MLWRLLIFISVMGVVFDLKAQDTKPTLEVFAVSSCEHCQALMLFLENTSLQEKPLPIQWYYINKDKQALEKFYRAEKPYLQELNALQVPSLRICGVRFVGFENTEADKKLLSRAIETCLVGHGSGSAQAHWGHRLQQLAHMYAFRHASFAFMQSLPAMFVLDTLHMCAWFVWGLLFVVSKSQPGFSRLRTVLAVAGISLVHAFGLFFPQFLGMHSVGLSIVAVVLGLMLFMQWRWSWLAHRFASISALCLPAFVFYYQQQCEPSFSTLLVMRAAEQSHSSKDLLSMLLLLSGGYFLGLLLLTRLLSYLYHRLSRPSQQWYIGIGLRCFAAYAILLLWFNPALLSQLYLSLFGFVFALLISYGYWWIDASRDLQE